MKKTTDVFEKIITIELENDFFDFIINDVKIWQYVRFNTISFLIEEITGVFTANRSNYSWQMDNKSFIEEPTCKSLEKLTPKDMLIVNHCRRIKDGEVYKCFVTDEFLENTNYSYYVFEDEYKGVHYSPTKTKNLKYRNENIVWDNYKYRSADGDEIRSFVEKICNVFQIEFEMKLTNAFKTTFYSIVKNTLEKLFYYKKYSELILAMVQPRICVVTVAYSLQNQALISVAKEWGIPTVELEHGRIGDAHVAYNYKRELALESFPDYVFVYGEYEKTVPRFPISRENIYSVGYPELEAKAKLKKEKRNDKIITMISSPVDGKIMYNYAMKLHEEIEKNNLNYKIIYKLHPSEYSDWGSRYPKLKQLNIDIIDNNNHDIYYYLNRSNYVIGISSTVLFEAMLFDIGIIIIKESDYEKTEIIHKKGMAKLVSSINELLSILEFENVKEVSNTMDNFYFERNSLSKMEKALSCCMKQSNDVLIDKVKLLELQKEAKKIFKQHEDCIIKYRALSNRNMASFDLMRTWFQKKQTNKNIGKYLEDMNIKKIAIYGMNDIGEILLKELEESSVSVKYGIDRNARGIFSSIPVYLPNEPLPYVDMILVSAVYYFDEIKYDIELRTGMKVYSLIDLVKDM